VNDAPAAFAEVRVGDGWLGRLPALVARAAEPVLRVFVADADLAILVAALVEAPQANWAVRTCLKTAEVGILVVGHACSGCI